MTDLDGKLIVFLCHENKFASLVRGGNIDLGSTPLLRAFLLAEEFQFQLHVSSDSVYHAGDKLGDSRELCSLPFPSQNASMIALIEAALNADFRIKAWWLLYNSSFKVV